MTMMCTNYYTIRVALCHAGTLSASLRLPPLTTCTCLARSVHPWLPVLASSSGQRHLDGLLSSSDDEEQGCRPPRSRAESAVKLWWLGD